MSRVILFVGRIICHNMILSCLQQIQSQYNNIIYETFHRFSATNFILFPYPKSRLKAGSKTANVLLYILILLGLPCRGPFVDTYVYSAS